MRPSFRVLTLPFEYRPLTVAVSDPKKQFQRIRKISMDLEAERRQLSILKKPLQTLYYFNLMVWKLILSGIR